MEASDDYGNEAFVIIQINLLNQVWVYAGYFYQYIAYKRESSKN